MGGHPPPRTAPGVFTPPVIRGRWAASLMGATCWFFVYFRIYHDGGHHFLHKHVWEEPKMLAYMEKVDEQYGTRYAKDNIHGHH